MFPNLMGTDEFPKVDQYLFIAGPKHGQRLEVPDMDPIHRVICPPSSGSVSLPGIDLSGAAPGYDVHTYVRREIGAQDGSEHYVRTIYVHEDVPNADAAQAALIAALLAEFIKGGRKVIDEHGRGA